MRSGVLERGLLPLSVAVLLWAAQFVIFSQRPLLPVDETRYLTVAWEMYFGGDYLVPHLNGQLYSHKPPLLFWLINLVWSFTGPSVAGARVIVLAANVASALLTGLLARALWPELRGIAAWAVMTFAGLGLVNVFFSMVMFDSLLTLSVLTAVYGMVMVWLRGNIAWWGLVALGFGFGILSKGPVALMHVMAAGAVASLAFNKAAPGGRRGWYLGLAGAIVGGILVALTWVVPAAIAGDPEYRKLILWDQTAERMVESFAHAQPWWFYLPILPLFLLPWGWWPPAWRWVRDTGWRGADPAVRFCVIWFASLIVAFSMISAKQIHYILPGIPAIALLAAVMIRTQTEKLRRGHLVLPCLPLLLCGLCAPLLAVAGLFGLPGGLPQAVEVMITTRSDWPLWIMLAAALLLLFATPQRAVTQAAAIALASGITLAASHLAIAPTFEIYDWTRVKTVIAKHQNCGLAWVGDYAGEFGFIARVTQPVDSIVKTHTLPRWFEKHPGGLAIDHSYKEKDSRGLPVPDIVLKYRGKRLAIWISQEANPACP